VRIETAGAGYRLCVPVDALDASLFAAQVHMADAAIAMHQDQEALRRLRDALALWRGPALDGLTGLVIEAAATEWNERRCARSQPRNSCWPCTGAGRHPPSARPLCAHRCDGYSLAEPNPARAGPGLPGPAGAARADRR
jgi:Bacterial transcriptional activator domain